jgi:hypothetical protein
MAKDSSGSYSASSAASQTIGPTQFGNVLGGNIGPSMATIGIVVGGVVLFLVVGLIVILKRKL